MEDDYFKLEALSASGAKLIARSPAHYKAAMEMQRTPTPAQVFGTVVHAMILEPHKSHASLFSVKELNWTTKEGKLEKERLESIGLPIISAADLDKALRMRDAVWAHSHAAELLTGCRTEVEATWIGYEVKVRCKGGIDAIGSSGIVDVKTTIDASPEAFAKAIKQYGYYMQAAHYIDGVAEIEGGIAPFTFIAVEKQPPYAVACYTLSNDSLAAGWSAMNRIAKIYSDCISTGIWPGYEGKSIELSIPINLDTAVVADLELEDF